MPSPRVLRFAAVGLVFALTACGPSGGGNADRSGDQAVVGGDCSNAGATFGQGDGTLVCTPDPGTGVLHWQDSSGAGNQFDPAATPAFYGNRVGEDCATSGEIGFADGAMTVCRDSTVGYALRGDVDPVPAGGYQQRPDWYPTLSQISGVDTAACPQGSVTLTHPFLPAERISRSVPYGAMIGNHVTPIDHMYVGIDTLDRDPAERTDADYAPVTAPGDGMILEASSLGDPGSHRVVIAHGCDIVSVYMVLNRLTGVLAPYADLIETGGQLPRPVPVQAGDEFGRQRDNALDFNIFDGSTWLTGFADPFSYADGEPWKPYTADPARVFDPAVWAPVLASLQRTSEPRIGVIDHDVAGTAAGNWFLDGTIGYSGAAVETMSDATGPVRGGSVPGKNLYSWGHLSLAPHWVDTAAWVFSTGTWSDPAGDGRQFLLIIGDQPAPDALRAGDGPVVYRVAPMMMIQPDGTTRSGGTAPDAIGYTVAPGPETAGWVIVDVLDDGRLSVEVVVGGGTAPGGFSGAQRTYHR